jgi:hypothetical protein
MKFLKSRGYKVGTEVRPFPNSSRRVDVVGIKPRLKEVVAVEAKISNYSVVKKQAENRLFIADLVYVSFPIKYAFTVLDKHKEELVQDGIGVIGINGRAVELLNATRSMYVSEERKNRLMSMVIGEKGKL